MEHNKLVGCIRAYIRNAIAATGMSNDDFRSAFGNLSHNALRLWLNGRYLPTVNNLLRIEALSGVSLDGSGIRIHSALECMQEIIAAARRGIPIKHIAIMTGSAPSTISRIINGKSTAVNTMLNIEEGWRENDCTQFFASENYVSELNQFRPKKRNESDAVKNYVKNNFGPSIVKGLEEERDGLWKFTTDRLYECSIEHIDGDKYRFTAVFKPKDRVSVERVILIAS